MAADLKLKALHLPWHTQRDEWVALGCELGLLVGSLGKIAKDISLMGQYEVGELAEPTEPGPRWFVGDAAQTQSGGVHGGAGGQCARAAARGRLAGHHAAGT
jgi:hypothetical protein